MFTPQLCSNSFCGHLNYSVSPFPECHSCGSNLCEFCYDQCDFCLDYHCDGCGCHAIKFKPAWMHLYLILALNCPPRIGFSLFASLFNRPTYD